MGNGGELSSCEVMFLTGSDGVRLARFKDCIARMSMSLEVVRTDMDQPVGGQISLAGPHQSKRGSLHGEDTELRADSRRQKQGTEEESIPNWEWMKPSVTSRDIISRDPLLAGKRGVQEARSQTKRRLEALNIAATAARTSSKQLPRGLYK